MVDSTGIYFNPMLRHLDRGSQEVDNGHYLQYEYVFGATAAAALYRRAMIDDISLDGEFFDSDFFVYREDADVAWRAQLMGWKCLYAPYARGYHVRKVLPGNRRALPPEINMHSVKNRFLMRIKNISPDLYWRNWFSITTRDLMVVMCCLLWEHTSLKAFWFLAQELAARAGQAPPDSGSSRRVDDEYMASWFQYAPVSQAGAQEDGAACSRAPKPPRRNDRQPMRIALLGTRGIPANYGGFETFAEELSDAPGRARPPGHRLLPRARIREPTYRGVRLQYLPTIRHKYFDTLAHTVRLHAPPAGAPRRCGALLQRRQRDLHAAAARCSACRWRSTWTASSASARSGTALAKAWYLVSEWLATFLPDRGGHRRRDHPGLLPRALRQGERRSSRTARRSGRSRARGRARQARARARPLLSLREPHGAGEPSARSAPGIRAAWRRDMKLALIGDAPYAQRVHPPGARHRATRASSCRARFTAQGYRELGSHCFAYIHATEVGGTHPALIEAMGRGALVLYRNTPENAEVAGDAGIPFEDDLARKIECALAMPEADRDALRRRAMEIVRERYSWDAVTSRVRTPAGASRGPGARLE